tara:strand:- start:1391 stop:1834 length:444 start_codon:yes stop_codon:yes gene_type:complete
VLRIPDSKTHVSVGAIVAGAVFLLIHKTQVISTKLEGPEWIVLALIVYLYSQLPDIDADVSVINKIWNTTAGIIGLYTLYSGKYKIFGLFAVATIVALEWVKHRGVTHTVPFVALMSAPLYIVNPLFAVVGFTTALSHIILDGDLGK